MKFSKWEKGTMKRIYVNNLFDQSTKVWIESSYQDEIFFKVKTDYKTEEIREFENNVGYDFFIDALGISSEKAKNLKFAELWELVA